MKQAAIRNAYYVYHGQSGYWHVARLNDYRNNGVPAIDFATVSGFYPTSPDAYAALASAAERVCKEVA